MSLKRLLWSLIAKAACLGQVHAQQYLRIGTRGTAGTHHPLGVLVTQRLSQPGKIWVSAQRYDREMGVLQ